MVVQFSFYRRIISYAEVFRGAHLSLRQNHLWCYKRDYRFEKLSAFLRHMTSFRVSNWFIVSGLLIDSFP